MTQEQKIEHALRSFGIISQVAHQFKGFSSDTFLLAVSAGTKISSIKNLRLEMANALDVEDVRISSNLVVYEGKSHLSVEISKDRTENLYYNPDHREGFKIPLGKDNFGRTIIWDLDNQSTPHMEVCGATGSGKSVFMECILAYAKEAGVKNIIILDPKKEYGKFSGPGVDVIHKISEIEFAIQGCVEEMNRRIDKGQSDKTLILFDEYPNAIERARKGAELKRYEEVCVGTYANGNPKYKRECVGEIASLGTNMASILEMGRSSGFRVIIGMQRASTDIISGDMKNNMPVRVCFAVQKQVDSIVVLDEPGAEKLKGKGDGLLRSPEYRDTVRFQAYYKPANTHA